MVVVRTPAAQRLGRSGRAVASVGQQMQHIGVVFRLVRWLAFGVIGLILLAGAIALAEIGFLLFEFPP
jgi:hypothetical protein